MCILHDLLRSDLSCQAEYTLYCSLREFLICHVVRGNRQRK